MSTTAFDAVNPPSRAEARLAASIDAAHPDGQYSGLAKLFHWVTVVLILIALPMGFLIGHAKDESKMLAYAIHESAGVTIFLVAVLRLAWRWLAAPPALPADIPGPMRAVAHTVHGLLYLALIVQPVLGFVATNAWGFPLQGATAYLGFIEFPRFMDTWEGLAQPVQLAHTILGWSIVVLLVLHVGGALFHHVLRRDGTLLRML